MSVAFDLPRCPDRAIIPSGAALAHCLDCPPIVYFRRAVLIMTNPIPYPLTVFINCNTAAYGGGHGWQTELKPFLVDAKFATASVMRGEGAADGSDASEGIARELIAMGTQVFYYEHRGDNPNYTRANPPFWHTISTQDMAERCAYLHDRAPGIIPIIFREHFINPALETPDFNNFEEMKRWVAYCIDLIERCRVYGIEICVGGWPVGVLDPAHIDAGLYDPLLDVADYIDNHEYFAVCPMWHDPTKNAPPDKDTLPVHKWPDALKQLVLDTLHPDNWTAPCDVVVTPHSFIGRLNQLMARCKGNIPVAVITEGGADNPRPFDPVREFLRGMFGDSIYQQDDPPRMYNGVRGFNSYRKIYESTGLDFSHYLYKTFDWMADFYTCQPIAYSGGVHLYMYGKEYGDSTWAIDGFDVSEYRNVLLQHARDWRTRPPAPPTSPPPIVVIPPVVIDPPTPSTIDVLPYLRGDGRQYTFSSSERMRTEQDGARWYQVKNHQFEEMWVYDDAIYRGIDTSPGNGEVYLLWADGERTVYGNRWMPRYVQIGDVIERSAWVDFRRKDNGAPVASKSLYRHDSMLKVAALHDHMTFPSGVQLDDVLELRGVDNGGAFEAYFYARDYGLVMWKNLRGTDTYHITQDNVTAPPLERETLAWWDAMEKPTAPADDTPSPPDTDGVVLELARRIQALAQQLAENTAALVQLLATDET